MIITAEMSLYPLTTDYEEAIIGFIKELKRHDNLQVWTFAMSTYVKGENHKVLQAIAAANESLAGGPTASLVIKIINRDLPVENSTPLVFE